MFSVFFFLFFSFSFSSFFSSFSFVTILFLFLHYFDLTIFIFIFISSFFVFFFFSPLSFFIDCVFFLFCCCFFFPADFISGFGALAYFEHDAADALTQTLYIRRIRHFTGASTTRASHHKSIRASICIFPVDNRQSHFYDQASNSISNVSFLLSIFFSLSHCCCFSLSVSFLSLSLSLSPFKDSAL